MGKRGDNHRGGTPAAGKRSHYNPVPAQLYFSRRGFFGTISSRSTAEAAFIAVYDEFSCTPRGPCHEHRCCGPAATAAGAAGLPENPVLKELTTQGVKMPEGTVVKLPPPLLDEGMDAAAQRAAIEKIIPPRYDFDAFTAHNSDAPVSVALKKPKSQDSDKYTLRKIDVYFVARGSWDVLSSKAFSDTILKKKKEEVKKQPGGSSMTAGFLSDKEMQKRKLKAVTEKHSRDRYFYSTFRLFDEVEVSATRYVVVTDTPAGVVIAGRIDPRFAMDKEKEYPNQWRRIDKDALGTPVFGPWQPYWGTGFYLKATRLKVPEDAIFVEVHSAFNEPHGWFDGEPTLSSSSSTSSPSR